MYSNYCVCTYVTCVSILTWSVFIGTQLWAILMSKSKPSGPITKFLSCFFKPESNAATHTNAYFSKETMQPHHQASGIHTHTHTHTHSRTSHLHTLHNWIVICFMIIFRLHVHVHVPTATKIPAIRVYIWTDGAPLLTCTCMYMYCRLT